MAIVEGITDSFKLELPQGIHTFTGAGDTFKIALYESAANLSRATTAYTTTGEVTGTGYTAGGATLTLTAPVNLSGTVVVDFADVSWTSSSITARGALIYNETEANRSVMVLDFGSDRTSVNNTFTIQFPLPDSVNGILRIS